MSGLPDSQTPLVWIDMEMSGLDPERERILEIAVLVTSAQLEILAEGPELVVHQPQPLLDGMDDWNREHHTASGLVERVQASKLGEAEAERQVLDFLRQHCPEGKCPLAGNSVHQDRRFLRRYMSALDAFLHYRIVDVSTVKELVGRWYPQQAAQAPPKAERHRALEDIRESLAELAWYRREFFRKPGSPGESP